MAVGPDNSPPGTRGRRDRSVDVDCPGRVGEPVRGAVGPERLVAGFDGQADEDRAEDLLLGAGGMTSMTLGPAFLFRSAMDIWRQGSSCCCHVPRWRCAGQHSARVDAQNVNAAVSALGAVLSGVAAVAAAMGARWQTRCARQVALETTHSQGAVERALRLEAQRSEAWTAFLCAADAYVDAVWTLGGVAPESRVEVLRVRSEALRDGCSGLRVLGPDRVVRHAEAIRERCSRMDQYAVKRAVVRSALLALEEGWCPGNAEHCQSDAHVCAWLAYEMLEGWGDREEDERPDDLDFLEYLIRESGVLKDPDLVRLLAVARSPVCWELLTADERWLRPRTGFYEERDAFTIAVRDHLEASAWAHRQSIGGW